MINMKKSILLLTWSLLTMIAVSCGKNGGGHNDNDIIEFKDPNFQNALLTHNCAYVDDFEHPTYIDTNNDGKISFGEAKNVELLALTDLVDETAESYNIEDISEIKYFTGMIGLICDDNKLTSIDVSKNTPLEMLSLNDNQLTSLDISKNVRLVVLNCDRNKLTSLDVSKNTALKGVSVDNNQLTSLDVSNNADLNVLYCRNNLITTLDVSKNTSLKYFYCSGNKLEKLILPSENSIEDYCLKDIKKEYGEGIIEYK